MLAYSDFLHPLVFSKKVFNFSDIFLFGFLDEKQNGSFIENWRCLQQIKKEADEKGGLNEV